MQDHLQAALAQIAGHSLEVTAAGRTDAGVHATAQVVHFDTESERDESAWVRGTNSSLRDALRVVWARRVPDEFHARYSARSRTYRYILLNEPVAPAVLRQRVGWYHRRLDLRAMGEAARMVEGEHDFSAFRDAQCQAKSPMRNLTVANVEQRGNYFFFTFRANAFLHHMVRNLVGTLVYIGAGKHPPSWIEYLLDSRDRRLAAPTFMPDGLYLAGVQYDPAFDLPAFRDAIL